jgi:hypothetical protein
MIEPGVYGENRANRDSSTIRKRTGPGLKIVALTREVNPALAAKSPPGAKAHRPRPRRHSG